MDYQAKFKVNSKSKFATWLNLLLLKLNHRITHQNASPTQDLSVAIRPLSPIHNTSDSEQEFPDNATQISVTCVALFYVT